MQPDSLPSPPLRNCGAPTPCRRRLVSPFAHTSPHAQAGSHIDLRKRNQAFQSKVGKVNKLKQPDPLERKALPRWIIWLFLFLIVGGCACLPARECSQKNADAEAFPCRFFASLSALSLRLHVDTTTRYSLFLLPTVGLELLQQIYNFFSRLR